MLQNHDRRFADGENGLGEIVLVAEQVQIIAVARMIGLPCFARGLLISAEGQDDEIGCLREFYRRDAKIRPGHTSI